jgi:Concanavalin A-like lectin/glucanases superfamily
LFSGSAGVDSSKPAVHAEGVHAHTRRSLLLGLVVGLQACGQAAPEERAVVAPSYDGKNRVLSFDGLNDYVTTGTAAFPLAHHLQTVALWVRPVRVFQQPDGGDRDGAVGPDDRQSLVVLRKDFESGIVVGLHNGVFEVWGVFSRRTYVKASMPAEPLAWQHVAYTFDESKHRLFVDGKLVDEGDSEPQNRTPTTAWLGTLEGSSELFVGEMDTVRVYDAALSDAVIAVQSERGRSDRSSIDDSTGADSEAGTSNLVLWLGFDEVSGHKAFDRSARGNDALLGDGIVEHMPDRLIDP